MGFLPQVDEIIMIENGKIVEAGTFEQLKDQEGVFAHFINNHLNICQIDNNIESNFLN